ncbi:MAG: RNase adapter RapZ [Pseudomonadota bacterium]|nr:RNase adapter RapZ [Pseudomonadota bacterium]
MDFYVITGRSGSGKSTVLKVFEDQGFYCSDNIPLALLPNFFDWCEQHAPSIKGACVGLDVRNGLERLTNQLTQLDELFQRYQINIIYLDATDDVLIKRFSATRRKHPLSSQDLSLETALTLEKQALNQLASMSKEVILTSDLSLQALKNRILDMLVNHRSQLTMVLMSFGFKNGLPSHADMVFDARVLPNPHWDADLREQTGLGDGVREYLQNHEIVDGFVNGITEYLGQWLPRYQSSERSYLTVAVGCTGGQHRSVYVVSEIAKRMPENRFNVLHRDMKMTAT